LGSDLALPVFQQRNHAIRASKSGKRLEIQLHPEETKEDF